MIETGQDIQALRDDQVEVGLLSPRSGNSRQVLSKELLRNETGSDC